MITKHIILKTHLSDSFQITPANGDSPVIISLDQGDDNRTVNTPIEDYLSGLSLQPTDVMFDLLQFALGVYTIDQTVSRRVNGFQGWSRNLVVYFPVTDKTLWDGAKEMLQEYIGFLSGDKWEFQFRQKAEISPTVQVTNRNPENYTQVCLLSGGLDSFIAAVDLLSAQQKPMFVSHYKTGTESSAQRKVVGALETKFGKNTFISHRIRVQPKINSLGQKENSSRARSLLFICLGLAFANSLGDNVEMILPENGLISLNIPLTKTRLSSHSTRTTHPYFVDGLNKIIAHLGIHNPIVNPYRFKTKGEMMVECRDTVFLGKFTPETISCSHPENSRYAGESPGLNCGYCVPCVIRQSAEHKAGQITTKYALDIKTSPPNQKAQKGSDYRAFKLAFERLDKISHMHSFALQIIRSGPIPYSDELEFSKYISVYRRGMNEVKQFLNS